MLVLISVSGLTFLFSYLIFARLSFNLTVDRLETGLEFTLQAFSYFAAGHRFMEYNYQNLEFDFLLFLHKADKYSERLKKRSRYKDLKAYLLRLSFHDYRSWLETICNFVIIEEISWKTRIGLQDAMYTGIFTGIVWAIKGMCTSMVTMNSPLEKLKLTVEPVYGQETFTTNLHCIIKIRIVHIIFIAVYLLYKIVRGFINGYRPGKKEPSYRRAYENGYAKY